MRRSCIRPRAQHPAGRALAQAVRVRGKAGRVDAGYDRIYSRPFLEAFQRRIVNVHPSLLPAFGGGMDAVEQALRSGVTKTGATVHLVIEDIDAGPILAQESVPVLKDDTVETLRRRIHEAEYRILPAAIRLLEARLAESPAIGQ